MSAASDKNMIMIFENMTKIKYLRIIKSKMAKLSHQNHSLGASVHNHSYVDQVWVFHFNKKTPMKYDLWGKTCEIFLSSRAGHAHIGDKTQILTCNCSNTARVLL